MNKKSTKNVQPYNKYNWLPIKQDYVEGYDDDDNNHIWPTMSVLSKKYFVPPVYLRKIASENNWTNDKKKFIIKYEQTMQVEAAKQLAKRASKFDNRCMTLAEEGIRKVEKILYPEKTLLNTENCAIPVLTLNDLELAAKTLEKFQKVGRSALGKNDKKQNGNTIEVTFAEGLGYIESHIADNPNKEKELEDEFIDK